PRATLAYISIAPLRWHRRLLLRQTVDQDCCIADRTGHPEERPSRADDSTLGQDSRRARGPAAEALRAQRRLSTQDGYRRKVMSTRRLGSGAGLTGPSCVYSGHQPAGAPITIP